MDLSHTTLWTCPINLMVLSHTIIGLVPYHSMDLSHISLWICPIPPHGLIPYYSMVLSHTALWTCPISPHGLVPHYFLVLSHINLWTCPILLCRHILYYSIVLPHITLWSCSILLYGLILYHSRSYLILVYIPYHFGVLSYSTLWCGLVYFVALFHTILWSCPILFNTLISHVPIIWWYVDL